MSLVKQHQTLSTFFKYFETKQIASVVMGKGLQTGPPNPANHWGVRVGDVLHQLQADGDHKIFYQSVKFDEWGGFDKYPVGYTTMNDGAIQSAGTFYPPAISFKTEYRYPSYRGNARRLWAL